MLEKVLATLLPIRTGREAESGRMLEKSSKNDRGGILGVISRRRPPNSTKIGQMFDQMWPDLGQVWASVAKCCPHLPKVGQDLANLGQIWSKSRKFWSNLASGAKNVLENCCRAALRASRKMLGTCFERRGWTIEAGYAFKSRREFRIKKNIGEAPGSCT